MCITVPFYFREKYLFSSRIVKISPQKVIEIQNIDDIYNLRVINYYIISFVRCKA